MRITQLWNDVPLPATLKLVWDRITFSRLTLAYFVFSFLHAILQLSLQIKAFTVNAEAASFLSRIVVQGEPTNGSLPFLDGPSLFMCDSIPNDLSLNDAGCHMVWNGTQGTNVTGTQTEAVAPATSSLSASSTSASTSATVSSISSVGQLKATGLPSTSTPTVTIFVLPTPSSGSRLVHEENLFGENQVLTSRTEAQAMAVQVDGQTEVQINGMTFNNASTLLDRTCLMALNWPVSVLGNTKREDLVFIGFQLWLLGISIVALLNESIPHSLASLITHMMATAWAVFNITNTANFRSDFNRVVTNGACNGTSLLPAYWRDRAQAEIPSLALNTCAMLVSCFLTWKLIKLFGWQTFKRVGASLTINRVYQIVLVLSIAIQLCTFFIAVTVSLWLDQLFNEAIENQITFEKLYKITSIITLILTIPWLTTGWFAVRRELRALMFVFLMLSLLYLGGWSVMFFSPTFRWTFITWRFFSIMASASVFLTVVCFVLGVICRFNFGKGLLRYLSPHQVVVPNDYDVYHGATDIEKVEFPSDDKLVPTYSAAFRNGRDDTLPSKWFATRGPRFFTRFARPFETITRPQTAHTLTRKVSDGSLHGHLLARSDSLSSFGSKEGYYSDSKHSRTGGQQKRWLIE